MNNLQTKFERDLQRDRFFYSKEPVIVAVSTGSDSMCLLMLLLSLPTSLQPTIVVAHVNHELRHQSAEEERFLAQFCQQHHLKLEVCHWPKEQHPATGIETAARKFRYHFFEALMNKYASAKLLTAHHLNDQAETILMKLTRGGQLSQLSGMATRRQFGPGELIRPLLHYSKAELREYLTQNQVRYYEDQTNQTLEFSRNRYRNQILPLLTKENNEVLNHLASFGNQLAELTQFADLQLGRLWQQVSHDGNLVIPQLSKLSQIEQHQVVRYWLINIEQLVDIKESQIETVEQLVRSETAQAQLDLGNQIVFEKEYQVAKLSRLSNAVAQEFKLEDFVSTKPVTGAIEIWLPPEALPLTIRKADSDDEIRLKDGHHQKVRRILIDQKVPNEDRLQQLVVVTRQNEPIWIVNRKFTYLERPDDYKTNWQKLYFMPQLNHNLKGD